MKWFKLIIPALKRLKQDLEHSEFKVSLGYLGGSGRQPTTTTLTQALKDANGKYLGFLWPSQRLRR